MRGESRYSYVDRLMYRAPWGPMTIYLFTKITTFSFIEPPPRSEEGLLWGE
jgi:hypothetical protein